VCDAAANQPLAEPLVCKCRNGGVCKDDTTCACEPNFTGRYCENEVQRIPLHGAGTPAAVVVPVFLIVIIIFLAVGLFLYWRKKGTTGSKLGNFPNPLGNVHFRNGPNRGNVEFSNTSMVNTGGHEDGQTEFGLQDVTTEGKRDFSNPMYEEMGNLESEANAAAVAGNFVIPSSSTASSASGSPASTLAAGASGFAETPSAILAPSSVTHKSSPQFRQKETAPSSVDTGKDTQCLVTEDDSEC